jgi:hypothetical protein
MLDSLPIVAWFSAGFCALRIRLMHSNFRKQFEKRVNRNLKLYFRLRCHVLSDV